MPYYLLAFLALLNLAREFHLTTGVGYPRPGGKLKNGAISTTQLVLHPDVNDTAKIGSKITFHFKDMIAQPVKSERQLRTSYSMNLTPKMNIGSSFVMEQENQLIANEQGLLPRLVGSSDGTGGRRDSMTGVANSNSASLPHAHSLQSGGLENKGLPSQVAVVNFVEFANEGDVPNVTPNLRMPLPQDFLPKQKSAAIGGSKKQFSTDDFLADTMLHPPYIQSIEPLHSESLDHPNHVEIDYPEEIHVEPMHHEMPLYPHIEHPIPVHIEEPVIVHHLEPPPPPPPEPVLIPIPIVTSPPPPPPPPPPCTVHIPVTIHLKGKLAIKMKHCENCDFSKNIEAIGPLKVSPINEWKESLAGAVEAQARRIILTANDASGDKRNMPMEADYNEVKEALPGNAAISLDTETPDEEVGTKKDIPVHSQDELSKQHLIIRKDVQIPLALVPGDAYKRGVVISLPKGKALLRCVVSRNETLTEMKHEGRLKDETNKIVHVSPGNSIKEDLSEDDLSAKHASANSVIIPQSMGSVIANKPSDDDQSIGDEDYRQSVQGTGHASVTDQFLKLFDKDMMISLYKMAVRDIMREFRRHRRKQRNGSGQTFDLRDKVKSLFSQRSELEEEYPGIGRSLVSIPAISQFSQRMKRSPISSDKSQRTASRSPPREVQNASAGVRRVKLVDTDHPIIRQNPKATFNPPNSLAYHSEKFTDATGEHKVKASFDSGGGEFNGGLTFYGDIDPSNLIDDEYGASNCIDVTCEKQKAFLTRAGSYYEKLDNLALQPYKNFLRGEEKNIGVKNRKNYLIKLPYEEVIPLGNVRRFKVEKYKRGKKRHPNVKRQSIFEALSRAAPFQQVSASEEIKKAQTEASRRTSADVSENHEHEQRGYPSTIVELYGKLPRVPLKITLNPKGPLAKLQRPITIDLKPPEPGKGPETASAKTNDPNVMVRLENKIFKDDPLDQKAQEKLQAVYADIKKRRRRAISHHSAVLRSEKRARGQKTAKEDAQNGDPRTKIIVSLPKELTKLATFGYLAGTPSETVVYRSPSPTPGSAFAASGNAVFGNSRSESANKGHQLGLTSSGVSYVVGEANENKHVAALGQTPNEDARAQVEQFAKSLKALQEQAKQAMVHLHTMQQGEHDPYADIGSRRRFKGRDTHSDVGDNKKKSRNGIKRDPYADMGVTVNQDKRARINAQTAVHKLHKPTNRSKSSVASDPYADIGGHMVLSKRSSAHNRKIYKNRRVKAKIATANLSAGPAIRTEKSLKEEWPIANPLKTKDVVPTGVAAQTLIRHLPVDNLNLKESVQVSQKSEHNSTMESKIEASSPAHDDPVHDAANGIDEPKDEANQANLFDEFPKFSAALKNVAPESREQLFEMRPFQFLKKLKLLSKAGNVSRNKHATNQGPNAAGKDPYADLGSAVDSSNFRRHFSSTRSTVPAATYRKFRLELANAAEDILENAQKRDSTDPDYDPYADLGTSIGLTQNESRMKSKAPAEVAKSRDEASSEAHPESVASSSEKSSNAHEVQDVENDGSDIFEKISREAVKKLLDSLKEKGIRIKDPVSLQQKLKAKFDKYRMAIEAEEPDSSTSFVENLQNGGYLKKSKARVTQGQSRFINQAASPSNTDATGDPYADLGSSANGDPLPSTTRNTASAHVSEATDQSSHRPESAKGYTETERVSTDSQRVTQATSDQPLVSLNTVLGHEELEQQAKAPTAMADNLRTSAMNKALDLGSTSTGISKLYNETASARVSGDNEMEAGDLAEPLDSPRSSDNPSRLDMAIREAAIAQLKRMKDERSPSSYEHLQPENGFRPTAELSKTLQFDDMKIESNELPVVGMLLNNVGKEVQGPYVDLGATPLARKKTLEAPASPRHNINVLADTHSKRHHQSEKRKALPAGKKLINRMASKKSMKKTGEGVEVNLIGLQASSTGKIQQMIQANPLLSETRSPAKVSVEPTKSVEVTDMNSEHTVTPENATNTNNISAVEFPAGDGAKSKNCLSTDSRQAMQLLRGAAEASVANLAGKASKSEDKDSDPYVWIGTSVPGARKETLSKTLRICGFPTPLQNWEAPVSLDAKAVLEQAELRLGESGTPSNSSVESTSAPSNATTQVAPVDPYAQLGTEVSSTRKRSRHPAVKRRTHGSAMNFIRESKAQLSGLNIKSEVAATRTRQRRGISSSGRNHTAKDNKDIRDRNKKDTKGHAKKKKLNNDPYADLGQVVDA